jgi:preprotein translocase subunit SecD
LAAPTTRRHPARPLITLGVVIVALAGAIFAGNKLSDATFTPNLALDLEGGTQIILTPVPQAAGQVTSTTISQAINVIRQRVDASGVSEAEITSQGSGAGAKIVVGLPGNPDEQTLALVRTSAQMEFRPVLQAGSPTATATATPTDSASPAASEAATPAASASADSVSGEPEATASASASAAADASATPTPASSPSATSSAAAGAGPESPSDTAYYVTDAVQQQFDQLDCSDAANRTGGVNGDPTTAFVTCDQDGAAKYILGPVELDGKRITGATSGLEQLSTGSTGTRWVVNLTLDPTGTDQFTATTTRLYSYYEQNTLNPPDQARFAIVLDGLVVSAPNVTSIIPNGRAEISGNFTRESAATLANQLSFGSLPVSFQVESEQQISATLGSEQLEKGLLAGLIGLILVVIYSLIQYRVLGFLTVFSLVIAAVITYLVITVLSWTQGYRLSLPGVAGLIVAIGITADSFIVYFERIRDELRDGRPLAGAVEHGWARARRTILASDAVNFLAAAVLYLVAVGGVRGFAFTLGLTTIIDLAIVFVFTHPMMEIISGWRFFNEGHALSGLDPRRLGVPETRYVGRGRVVTTPRAAAGDAGAAAREPVVVGAGKSAAGAAPGTEGMTIAERRAAARKAAQAPPDAPDSPATTEGDEH